MTIDEAIKILEVERGLAEQQPETGIFDAIKLGIEALIRERNNRINPGAYVGHLLLGETES